MDLFVVRHADAEPGGAALSDAQRALTDRGRRDFARVAKGLERLGVTFDRIHHSPLLRAQETAELLVPLLAGESIVDGDLAREPSLGLLASLRGESIALVGHEPHVTDLVVWLLFGWRIYAQDDHVGLIDFEKGAVAWLRGEPLPGRMQLVAFLPPRVMRKLRKRSKK